ncbi:hypothetical protein Lesp02_08290 [Lentzea sp. NBRC 105346]|nr:hypothetical protein Lesp02_08290 [Lentzea sp. NBRC 105346]
MLEHLEIPAAGPPPEPPFEPLSLDQECLWHTNQRDPLDSACTISLTLRLDGALDWQAVEDALGEVAERHESLRTVYPDTVDGPARVVLDHFPELTVVEVSEYELHDEVKRVALTGFDLVREIPLRATLFSVNPAEHALVLAVHEIAVDGWSLQSFAAELASAYAQRQPSPEWTVLPYPHAGRFVAEQFEAQVRRNPSGIAVIAGLAELSYVDLNDRANRFARSLIRRGIGPDDVVALVLPRSIDMIIAQLAVLKAGAAFLPIDPYQEESRIEFLLTDSRARLIVTAIEEGEFAPNVTDAERVSRLWPDSPAYLSYDTSEHPQRVIVSHAALGARGGTPESLIPLMYGWSVALR